MTTRTIDIDNRTWLSTEDGQCWRLHRGSLETAIFWGTEEYAVERARQGDSYGEQQEIQAAYDAIPEVNGKGCDPRPSVPARSPEPRPVTTRQSVPGNWSGPRSI